MNTRLLGAVLLLLLGFVVWLVWIRHDQPPALPTATSKDAGTGSSVTARLAPDPKVGKEDQERTAFDEPTGTSWVVRGEVMHGSVGPLPAAHFTARIFSGSQADGKPLSEATLTSDANGGFEWALPPPSETVTLSFAQNRADTTIMADARTVLVSDGPPQDVTVFAFLKDCQVTGTVTDQAQQPIAGAWVKGSYRDEPEPCDAAGRYRMVTSATYGDTAVVAGAPRHVLARQTVKVKGRNAKVVVDFELKPAVRLAGRITDEGNAPVPTALVYTFDTHAAAVRTDADGRYELLNIDPARESHTVQVEHDDYLTSQRAVARARLDDACDFVLKRGARVSGRVFGGDRVVAGAHIHLGEWIGYIGRPRAVSREDGTFEVGNVPAGEGQMTVFARGYATDQRPISVPEGKTEVTGLVVRLEPGHFVAGRVVDRDGNGLHRVRVTPLAAQRQRAQLASENYTRRDGSFRLTDLPAGKISIDCFGMHSARKEEQGVDVDRADVTIVMERPARLAGRVLDDTTGRPLARFSIRFVPPELRRGERQGFGYGAEWSNGLVFEDTDGYWSTDTERLEVGTVFGVEAAADGYGPAVVRRALPQLGGEPDALVLRLRPAARITGRVVDQRSGAGIIGAQLAVYDADHPLAGRDPFEDVRLACRTGTDGAFELAGLPAGQVSLVFQHPDWPLTFDGPFETVAGATTNRVLLVRAGATLTGTALDLQGNPLAGVKIARETIEIAGLRMPQASLTTDGAGRFRFPTLTTARYWLHASGLLEDGSTIVYSRNVDVTVGEDIDLQLAPAGRAAIHIELVADGAFPKALTLFIRRPTGTPEERPFSCSVSGSPFVVRGLPAGEFAISVSHYSGTTLVSGSGAVTLSAEGTAQVRIPLTTRKV